MRLDILRTAGSEGPIRDLDALMEEVAATISMDWREWQGRTGTWITDRVTVRYSGPSLATCVVRVASPPGRWQTFHSVVLPMHDDVSDDGPSILNHARSVVGSVVAALDALEPIDPALDRATLRAPHRCLGQDPMPWLTAGAFVSEQSIPERHGETLQVSLTTPWEGLNCSDVAGATIDIDPIAASAFDTACPKGLEVGVAETQGSASITIRPIDGVVGETMPELDDPVALLRTLRIATEAGALTRRPPDGGPVHEGDGS